MGFYLASLVGIAILWYFEKEYSERFQKCVGYYEAQYRKRHGDKEDPIGVFLFRSSNGTIDFLRSDPAVDSNTICTVITVDKHSSFFSMLFGAVVAAFTYTLWRATDKLGVSGDRQLAHTADMDITTGRAYLGVIGIMPVAQYVPIPNGPVAGWEITPIWRNTGRTPASEVKFYSIEPEIRADALPVGFDFKYSEKEKVNTVYVGAGQDIPAGVIKIPISDLIAWSKKEKRIFIFTVVEYRDVFSGTPIRRTESAHELLANVTQPLSTSPLPPNIPQPFVMVGYAGFGVYT
jgi:hypothetical protein